MNIPVLTAQLTGVVFIATIFGNNFHHVRSSENSENNEHNNNMSIIDDFLRRMENTRPDNCSLENLGPGVVQGLAQDRFKQQAMTAVTRANLLTYLWKHHPEALRKPAVLYMFVTNLVESDDQIFGAGNCYDFGQFNDSGIFCPYGYRDQASNSIIVKDLAKTHGYDDVNNTEHEWFHEIRRMGVDILKNFHLRELATITFNLPDEEMPQNYRTLRSKYEDGHWSLPYYDCGGGNIWMITYTVPFFGYNEDAGRYVFKGSSGIDIDLMKVDINQCDDEGKTGAENNVFANSHKCKRSTMCFPLAGKGFKRGSYKCVCKDGFYFPLELRTPIAENEVYFYNGTDVEKEFDKKTVGEENNYETSFDCIKCAPGCDTCVDNSPCLFPINWILRSALLAANTLFMLIACGWFVFIHIFRTAKPILAASPVLLHIILVGALLSYTPMIIHYFEPLVPLCIVQFWCRDIGFATIYSAMLFKTWRISIVFRPTKHRNVRITDMMLLKRIAIVVGAFAVLCILRTLIGMPEVKQSKHSSGMKTFACSFDFWDYGIAVCKVLFLIWGIYLTMSVRKTPSAFNESKFISWAIYNETIMAIFFNVSMFFLHSNSDPDLFYILLFLHIQLTVTGTTAFLFASKVYHVIRARRQPEKSSGLNSDKQKQAMRFVRHSTGNQLSAQNSDITDFNVEIPVGIAAIVQAMSLRTGGVLPRFPEPSVTQASNTSNRSQTGTLVGDSKEPLLKANGASTTASGVTATSGQDLAPIDNSEKGDYETPTGCQVDPSRSMADVVTVFFKLPESLISPSEQTTSLSNRGSKYTNNM